jgi:hypothetical protein
VLECPEPRIADGHVIRRLNVTNKLTSFVHGIAVIRLKTQQSEIMRLSFFLPLVFLGLAGYGRGQ